MPSAASWEAGERVHSYVLECEMKVSRGLRETFEVFENPHNLARITPPWLNFRVLDGRLEMRRGLEINYTIRWLGLPIRWRTLITAYDPPAMFIDLQARGPYRLWHHRHMFLETPDGGTLVRDEVTYVLPLGVLGRLAHALVVKRQLLGIFRYRQAALARMLGGGAAELRPPAVVDGLPVTEQQLADYRAQDGHGPAPQ